MSPRPWPRLGGVFSRLEIHLQYRRDFFSCLITPHWLKLNNKIYEEGGEGGEGEKVRKENVSYIVNSHLRPFPPPFSFPLDISRSFVHFAISFQLGAFREIFHVASFLTSLRGSWSLKRIVSQIWNILIIWNEINFVCKKYWIWKILNWEEKLFFFFFFFEE